MGGKGVMKEEGSSFSFFFPHHLALKTTAQATLHSGLSQPGSRSRVCNSEEEETTSSRLSGLSYQYRQ